MRYYLTIDLLLTDVGGMNGQKGICLFDRGCVNWWSRNFACSFVAY